MNAVFHYFKKFLIFKVGNNLVSSNLDISQHEYVKVQ